MWNNPVKKKGFTLIELLVVVAIIALLLAILIPGLQAAKEYASAAVCLSNQKGLISAWLLYSEENDGELVYGSVGETNPRYDSVAEGQYHWVKEPTDPQTGLQAFTPVARQQGIRNGKLYPYTQTTDLYHCPADKTASKYQEPFAAFRSYSISALMRSEDTGNRVISIGGINKTLRLATKMSDLVAPGDKFVFIEEGVEYKENSNQDPQQFNKGGFIMWNSTETWWDWPAYFHNDSSTLAFADGHAERHRWEDPRTVNLMRDGPNRQTRYQPANEDHLWLMRAYIPGR